MLFFPNYAAENFVNNLFWIFPIWIFIRHDAIIRMFGHNLTHNRPLAPIPLAARSKDGDYFCVLPFLWMRGRTAWQIH